MTKPRDTQRARLYRAERDAFGYLFYALDGQTWRPHALRTVAECQAFVDKVMTARGYVFMPFRVTDGRARRSAAASADGQIKLPRWARTHRVILHELAHLLRPVGTASHGPEYARTYVDLVFQFIGDNDAALLEMALENGGCRVSPSRGRVEP